MRKSLSFKIIWKILRIKKNNFNISNIPKSIWCSYVRILKITIVVLFQLQNSPFFGWRLGDQDDSYSYMHVATKGLGEAAPKFVLYPLTKI